MKDKRFYTFLHRQIPVIIVLSLFPGLGYILLGWLNGIIAPALCWYASISVVSCWGYRLYRRLDFDRMSEKRRTSWYRELSRFFYAFFLLWVVIFLLYVRYDVYRLHYIAIFTEIGAASVAASILASDRRLFKPVILLLMVPLVCYFLLIGSWYGYVLGIFAAILAWVMLYTANNTCELLEQTHYQATHDALTGLHNRQYFIEHLQSRINSLQEGGGYAFLLLIDLDHFKIINDSLGHDVGDQLLQMIAERLQQQVPRGSVVARLGGDEFMVAGCSATTRTACELEACATAERILAALKETYSINQQHLYISASIGVSMLDGRCSNAHSFIKEADIAMYEVKAKGRDGVFLFNEDMAARVERNLEMERLLHFALERGEISLQFQPQFDAAGQLVGAEALARWNNATFGSVPPDTFIAIAEQTGLILELGGYLLEDGLRTMQQWCQSGMKLDQLAINISMRQLMHHGFVAQVEALIRRYHCGGKSCGKIVFEITESVVAEDIVRVIDVLKRLKALGIRFSMDDFGTGYSSLNYLSRLPIDEIKIDRSFVAALGSSEDTRVMVTTILNMADIFKLRVVAEGVESAEQHAFLLQHRCHLFQGYHFARPLTREQFVAFWQTAVAAETTSRQG